MHSHHLNAVAKPTFKPFLLFLLLPFWLTGCILNKPALETVFFPPAPDPPHVQYLTSISSSADVKPALLPFLPNTPEPGEKISKPYGIAVRGSKLYVSDTPFSQLSAIDFKEKTYALIRHDALQTPINIALDQDGNIYLADTGKKAVLQFTAEGNLLRILAKGVTKPTDVAIYGDEIYVVDYNGSEVKVLDKKSGNQIRSIGREGKPEDTLSLPTNLALDKNGFIYVTNVGNNRIIKMDRTGKVIKAFGETGDRPGQFARPKGIAVDDEGLIYVVDAGHQVVQIFNQDAQLLMFFGERGSKAGTLNLPADIAISRDNLEYFRQYADPSFEVEQLIFVTNQAGPRKISVYGFGHQKGSDKQNNTTPPPGSNAPHQSAASEK
jgi:DNA-binding beta-propeller fold protein YncE